ncbi:hypothetical protein L4X63_15060 [Geomonas sp. Red32]|uniref:hypothetical protein n=1 Tax=Geomonas sp. Red32 TaxID=2912856 RepID=UPI00202CB3BB|nr:hypothetical protein [Geomonas sp. Red32]MCM0082912.1 hypothetical protein [Geomonas sp. Red32]
MDEDELKRRTDPIIEIMERRREEKEWSATEVMRILRKRAKKLPGGHDGGRRQR